MTREEDSEQLADAAWTLRDACKVSFHYLPHPGGLAGKSRFCGNSVFLDSTLCSIPRIYTGTKIRFRSCV
jgi:hypothetical protein